MSAFAFDNFIKKEIRKVIDYANDNIYQLDDILDMMNGQMDNPGTKPEHQVLVPIGRLICYYLVDHPNKGRCHYFQIKPDVSGEYPDRPTIEYIMKEFGIEKPLLDEHIKIDEKYADTNIILSIV
jgi:hypothetical protein